MLITFESGLKNYNKWIALSDFDTAPEPLRMASIKMLVKALSEMQEVTHYATVCWAFDKEGRKNGYKVTIHIEYIEDCERSVEVVLTSKYPWKEQRIFKTLTAAENFILSLGYQTFRVDMG